MLGGGCPGAGDGVGPTDMGTADGGGCAGRGAVAGVAAMGRGVGAGRLPVDDSC